MTDIVARLDQVSRAYGSVAVLDRFTLTLPAGRFVTLLGPSGCGKTTILRLLGGFDRPDAGRVWLADGKQMTDVTSAAPNRRNVNMVFQDYALFPHLTVAGNIAFGLHRRGSPRTGIAATVARLLALVRLEGMDGRMPDQLSGGQRQRVALARALARDPALLLLDEPLGALDAPLRAEMSAELQNLQRHTGKTFLLVTHDQAEAMAVSDLIVVIRRGRIEQIGTPERLYRQPATRFVATFLGENNVLRCRVERTEADGALLAWRGRTFPATGPRCLQRGASVEIAIRPEHVHCRRPGTRPDGVTGHIRHRAFRGSSVMLTVELSDDELLLAAVDPATAAEIGDDVSVAFDTDSVTLLDQPRDVVNCDDTPDRNVRFRLATSACQTA